MAVKRTYYKDRYNDDKVWEVAKLKGGRLLPPLVYMRGAVRKGAADYEEIYPKLGHP